MYDHLGYLQSTVLNPFNSFTKWIILQTTPHGNRMYRNYKLLKSPRTITIILLASWGWIGSSSGHSSQTEVDACGCPPNWKSQSCYQCACQRSDLHLYAFHRAGVWCTSLCPDKYQVRLPLWAFDQPHFQLRPGLCGCSLTNREACTHIALVKPHFTTRLASKFHLLP